jgi:hypothetical protein
MMINWGNSLNRNSVNPKTVMEFIRQIEPAKTQGQREVLGDERVSWGGGGRGGGEEASEVLGDKRTD